MEPSTSSQMTSRQKDKIYLVGHMTHQITGSKLPSIGQVLRSLFYNQRHVKKSDIKESAKLTISEVLLFWEKAKIPTRQSQHCVSKLEKLYEEWRALQKSRLRVQSTRQKEKVEAFKSSLEDLFDIAHQDALAIMKVEEDKQFLLQQRQKGRPGSMIGVDLKLLRAEERRERRKSALMKRQDESTNVGEFITLFLLF
uniref:Uncharacterized protein n=1 Tax=Cacopsylla melanoneura TaxID=428564 RepID=A0A8D8XUC3_9HEMI